MPFETNNQTETAGKGDFISLPSKLWLGLLEGRM